MASDGTLKFDTSLDSGGLQSGMGKVASIAQQALGVFSGQMMTRAVDSLVNLGKTALDSVGALEQNVGGVETLFGDTADAVIAAADRAYQTAGMSANDYMSTVTSFSASLLQSLSGNTEEAAKVADMAIIDMADNANKMGTSMDMIQNAYQGFAKQNYTMLDNLKLGYGGTKTEMERLLADAQELTGVKYDINNLNDVYQAIHVIQEEMGITGTTAKEASETLEGSMAAAKAAWDNFMNGSSDADQLADAFATAADNIVNNLAEIVPRFAETLPALAGAIVSQIPDLAGAIVSQIPDLAAAIVPAVLSAGQSILEQARDAVLDFDFEGMAEMVVESITDFINGDGLRSFLGCLVDIFTGIVNGISSMLPTLLPALVELIAYTVTTLIDQLPALLDCALQLIMGLADGILAALPVLIEALPEVISSIVQFLISAVPQIIDAGIELLMALVDALPVIIDALVDALPQIIEATVTALIAAAPQIVEAGIKLLGALVEAIPVIVVELAKAVPDIITAIIDVLAELPDLIGEVFAEIVTDLVEWGQQMLSNASTAMSNMLSKVNSIIQELPGKIWTHLVNAVNKVVAWGQQMVSNASTAASNMLSKVAGTLQQLPGKVWDYLSQAAQKVVTWGTQLAQKGAAAATQLFNSIVNGLASLPSKMAEIGSNIISGIWNGISSGWSWLTNKVSSLASSLLDAAKDALGINSPSKEFADEVGRWIMPGVGKGLDKTMPATLKDMEAKAGELVSAMRAEMSASAGQLSVGASHAAGLRMAGAGTTVYYDNRMEQSNTYNVPVATPSEVAKKQREALRNMVGGVK